MAGVNLRVVEAEADLTATYWRACRLAEQGQYDDARRLYAELEDECSGATSEGRLLALIRNDLGVLAALDGRHEDARQGWRSALEVDSECLPARLNGDLMEAEIDYRNRPAELVAELELAPNPARAEPRPRERADAPRRIAVLSFLFNWPSTGGGNMHTAGLVESLGRAGYEVRHYFARFAPWSIGRVDDSLPAMSEGLEFDPAEWNVAAIQGRFRRAVEAFRPDYVVITDAWNMKPLLAEAVRDFPYFLMIQGQENLCPLNNLRLLAEGPDQARQCPRNQLATPDVCLRCLAERGHQSGALHQVERALAGVATPQYDEALRRSLLEAEGVLVLNSLTAAMLEPFSRCVRIVPLGLDPARFPWPPPDEPRKRPEVATLFMAAVAGEFIKGFHVAHEARRLLRRTRSDFELVVTSTPPGPGRIDEFTRSVGWISQAELPRHYRAADICLVPTIAQDALSITSLEAMASGIPVIASRIGGLPYTVGEGLTGLLFEPGDPADLARQIARLIDDPDLRRRMGLAGRKRFEEEFTWPGVIERYWRPLLARRAVRG